MKNRNCDNDECKYNYKGDCIQSWTCFIGVTSCTEYIKTHKTPEELYSDLLERGRKDEDSDKDSE